MAAPVAAKQTQRTGSFHIKRKWHKPLRSFAFYGGAFVALTMFLASSYQAPAQQIAAEVAPVVNQDSDVAVDEVIAAQLTSIASERAGLPLASTAAEVSTSLAVRQELAQHSDTQIVKPPIVEIASTTRGLRTYTVQSGDTVSSIAARFEISTQTLRWANSLGSTNSLSRGTALTIPPTDGVVYTVRSGDTTASIANRYSASEQRIIAFNNLEIGGVKPGKKIVIPGGVVPRVTTTTVARTPYYLSGTVGNRYSYGYCTWYAYERRAASGRPVGSFWGNAYSWDDAARAQGYRVDHTPAAGAIFQSNSGYYGHVAYVESVDSSGNVHLREMNHEGWNVISSRTIAASQAGLYNYIH